MNIWKSIEEFYQEEKAYRCGHLLRQRFDALCEKYDAVAFTAHWAAINEFNEVPDVMNTRIREGAPDIRGYFDHFYSMKTSDGEIYWVVCPYDRGLSMLEVMRAFRANHIICDVMPGFYADYTIVIRPTDLIEACREYYIAADEHQWMVKANSSRGYPVLITECENRDMARGFADGANYVKRMLFGSNN